MKASIILLLILLLFTSCTNESETESRSETLSNQTLIGKWTWESAKVNEASNQQNAILVLGDKNCFEFDVQETIRCNDTPSTIVEECQTFIGFDISFEPTNVYDQNENYTHSRVQIDISNNCAITNYKNEAFDSFTSGNWSIEDNTIILTETYQKINSTFFGEIRESEGFSTSLINWKVLSFSTEEMIIFWRTPDQIDYEITFVKS
ncbi:hypothetical protein ACFQZJ_06155 [Maribacter chungangensis]|uniref:Lipocalin-like domain-containing protein n=1 Tax=Maribacter chungangensis TaxID=1069117 RepID=A0ABW3B201_9FLAO